MKKSFVLYHDYKEQFDMLTDQQAGQLIKAIFQYVTGEDVAKLDGITGMAFSFIKTQLDRDNEKYDDIVEKRREAGKLGGRPRKADGSEEKPKEANGSTEKAKKANGFSAKSKKAKKPVDVDDDVDVDEDVDVGVDDDGDDISKPTDHSYIHSPLNVTMYSAKNQEGSG